MNDPYDVRRYTGMRPRDEGLVYNDLDVAPPGTFGHPEVNPGERTSSPDLIERARAALTFTGPDTRFQRLVARFNSFLRRHVKPGHG